MFGSIEAVTEIGNMALQLSKNLRVYTNGEEGFASKIQTHAWRPDFESRVTVEPRRIRSLRMLSDDTSQILVTLDDGTQFEESYVVSPAGFSIYLPE
jgi:hypothetical protein